MDKWIPNWLDNIPGTVRVPHYPHVYYQPIYKNAHSTLMDLFSDSGGSGLYHGYPHTLSSQTFVVLRHPIDRWLSACNMILRSDWNNLHTVDFIADEHMRPQIEWLEHFNYDKEKLTYFDMKPGLLKSIIKHYGMYRYLEHKSSHLNKMTRRITIPTLQWDNETLQNVENAYEFLKKHQRTPEFFFLHKDAQETMEKLMYVYQKDIEFYESRKFVNQ